MPAPINAIAVHPINAAQITAALVTYASHTDICTQLTALKSILVEGKTYKCTKCGGSGTITVVTSNDTYCINNDGTATCGGNGYTSSLLTQQQRNNGDGTITLTGNYN